jgi:protein-disulfide isomerase
MATLKVPVSTSDHIQGSPDAPVVFVEYGDYECPHCGHAYPIVKRVQKHFGDRLAFVFRNFPLNQIHPNAEAAAETAEFAGGGGKFWEMHDAIFENQSRLGMDLLTELTKNLGLDAENLDAALESGEYRGRVKSDFQGGVRSGVNGTPSFFINGQRYNGAYDFDGIVAGIEAAGK